MTETEAQEPAVVNVGTTVSVSWRPRDDGARLTFVQRQAGTDTVLEHDPSGAPTSIVSFDGRISGRTAIVDWCPEGHRLIYTRAGDIMTYDTDTGEESAVTDRPGYDSHPRWGPDGKRIAFVSDRADDSIDVWLTRLHGDPQRLTTGAMPADEYRFPPSWAPGGEAIAYVAAADHDGYDWCNEACVYDLSTDTVRQLTEGRCLTGPVSWGPAGNRVAFLHTDATEPWYRNAETVSVVDLDADERTGYDVHASHQMYTQPPLWGPDGRVVYLPSRHRGQQHLVAVPVDPASDVEGVVTRVTNHRGVFGESGVRLSPDETRFGYAYSEPATPAHARVYQRTGGTPTTVQSPRSVEGTINPEAVTYESFDGLRINAYEYRPPSASTSTPVPALVHCHGGGHYQYGAGWHPVEQHLAASGFLVLGVDFRGSGGYGRAFQELSMGDWGGGQIRDVREAARHLRSLPYTTDEVGLYGYSWGGIVTLHGITQYPDVWDAAVEWYGISDAVDFYDQTDRVGRQLIERDLGGRPEEVPEAYRAASSNWRLDQVTAPLLALHGAEDKRVGAEQLAEMESTLAAASVPFESVRYEGEGHGFRDADTRRDAAARTRGWFNEHLR